MRRAALAPALLLLLPLVPSAPAFHEELTLPPLVATSTLAADGWTSLRVRIDEGTQVALRVDATAGPGLSGFSYTQLASDGEVAGSGSGTLWSDPQAGLQVTSTPFRVDERHEVLPATTSGPGFTLWMFSCSAACFDDEYVFVLTGAGDFTSATWALHADNATLLSRADGPGAFAYRSSDFDATLNAQATRAAPGSTRADVVLAGSLRLDVHDRLFGSYWRLSGGYDAHGLTLLGPSGARGCPCLLGGPGDGPGAYRFLLSGGAVESEVYLIGADARLPP